MHAQQSATDNEKCLVVKSTKPHKTRAGVYETLCPQNMLAPKDNLQMTILCLIPIEEFPCQKWEIIHSNIYKILPKVNQVIYT